MKTSLDEKNLPERLPDGHSVMEAAIFLYNAASLRSTTSEVGQKIDVYSHCNSCQNESGDSLVVSPKSPVNKT